MKQCQEETEVYLIELPAVKVDDLSNTVSNNNTKNIVSGILPDIIKTWGAEAVLLYRRIPINICRKNVGNSKSPLDSTAEKFRGWILKSVHKCLRRNSILA